MFPRDALVREREKEQLPQLLTHHTSNLIVLRSSMVPVVENPSPIVIQHNVTIADISMQQARRFIGTVNRCAVELVGFENR